MPNFKSINRGGGDTIAINIDCVTHFRRSPNGSGVVYLSSSAKGGGPESISLTKQEFEIFISGSDWGTNFRITDGDYEMVKREHQ